MLRTLAPPLTRPSRAGRGRRLAALGTALLTLLGAYLAVAAPPAGAADPLLSRGRPVTASSAESVAFPASAAVDGDAGTRWSSGFSDPQWLQVDLGVSATLTRVVLRWEAAYARAFTVETSPTGTGAWTTIHTTTAGAGGTQDLVVTGTGRFVRVTTTQRATQYGVSLWEFEVYGSTGPTTPPTTTPPTTPPPGGATLLSYAKPAVASTSQNDGACFGCTPDKAFDSDPASRWATSPTNGWVDPGWIYVDLGATATVTQVVLQWDPAYARSYQIQVSPNASTWTTVYSTTTGQGFREAINVTGTGRYVRMYGTARSSQYGYSLWEFKVYGTGGNPTPPPAMPADPTFPATRLVFADEFNGAAGSKPDPAKWTIDPGTGQNNEVQYYTNNDNANMDGAGSLVIEARRETVNGRDYTSHRMNTGNKFHVQYGRIEARIRVPKGNGLWPAFWMMGADFLTGRPWPYNGEIDIMEVLGRNTQEAYSTLHAPAYNGGGGYGQKYAAPGGVDLSAGYHVWSAEWDSRGITFKIDGQTVFTASKATVESTRGPWIFDHPFYLILNLAVGGDFPGPVDGTTPFPARMLVDYVRVYQ
ncbi:discoidin domain-containing protein [Micromonospora sp. NBC_01412]|uniref:discoidin domain-containing protein n=1 Tax=Micromonospora sp. NBC_01412 TaxID=2903590 RepID=UPI00324E4ACC